jgi:hypothetical protein
MRNAHEHPEPFLVFCSVMNHGLGFVPVTFTLFPEREVNKFCAGIFKQSMGARNHVGIGLSYRPARLQRLKELMP